jgi:hypothetical protein
MGQSRLVGTLKARACPPTPNFCFIRVNSHDSRARKKFFARRNDFRRGAVVLKHSTTLLAAKPEESHYRLTRATKVAHPD